MKFQTTLRGRLVMLMVAAILPLFGVTLVETWLNANTATRNAAAYLQSEVALAASHQDEVIKSAQQILLAITQAPGLVSGSNADCQRYLKTLQQQLPVYANLGLASPDGTIRCDALGNRTGVFLGDRDYFKAALAQRRFVVSGYLVGRVAGKSVVVFALPALDSAGTVGAVAFAAVDLSELAKAMAGRSFYYGGELAITDRQGIVLAANPDKSATIGQPVPSPVLREAVKSMRSGAGEGPDGLGHQRLFAFLPIGKSAGFPFSVAVSVDRELVLAAVQKELRRELLALTLLALLGGALAWVMAGRAIVRSTTAILAATGALEQGRLDARIALNPRDGGGEFSKIAVSFNHMADALQAQRNALAAELASSQAAREKLQDAQWLSRIGYWTMDLATGLIEWSDEVYELLGVERALLGTADEGFLQRIHPDDRAAYIAKRSAARAAGQTFNIEFRIITSAGEVRWIHLVGRNEATPQGERARRRAGVLQDITEQRESQAQMRLLETCIARLNDIVLITEGEPVNGAGRRTIFVNDAFERITGYRREEVLGKSLRFFNGPHTDPAELGRIQAARKKQQPVRAELINYTRNGEEFWVELDSVPVFDASGALTHWVTVGRDITGRKQAEQALHDSERRYAALFDAAPVPMYVFASDNQQFLAVNQAAIRGYGYSAEEFLSMTLFDIHDPAQHDQVRQKLADEAPRRQGTWRYRRKDGSVFPGKSVAQAIEYAGRSARFVVAQDISAQAKAEKEVAEHLFTLQRAADAAQAITWHQTLKGALQEVADQARGVIDAHMAVVSIHKDHNWSQAINIRSLSDKYAQYRGLHQGMDGSGIYALVCETNQPMRLTQAELEAHPRWRGFGRYAGKHPLLRGWLAVPLMARDGTNIGLLQLSDKYEGEFTQTDEYVALELAQLASSAIENARLIEEVGQLNAGLEHKVAERTAALRLANQELESFSYSVSHDLRSPLNTIAGFTQLLAKQLGDNGNDKLRHYLSRIQAGTKQMGLLISDLLALAQISRATLHCERVDLSALARSIADDLRAREPERQVALHIQSGLWAQADAGLLRVVLENLLGNAWKFSAKQAEAKISFGQTLDEAGEPVFFVRDNGAGFDMAYADKLFAPFQRLHAVAEFAGTGIGLATVKRVIDRHGGRLWADAAPGRGATFFFTLPRSMAVV